MIGKIQSYLYRNHVSFCMVTSVDSLTQCTGRVVVRLTYRLHTQTLHRYFLLFLQAPAIQHSLTHSLITSSREHSSFTHHSLTSHFTPLTHHFLCLAYISLSHFITGEARYEWRVREQHRQDLIRDHGPAGLGAAQGVQAVSESSLIYCCVYARVRVSEWASEWVNRE